MRQKTIKLRTLRLVLGVFLLSIGISYGQTQKVSGTVSDDTGPLPGVSVIVKGTTNGTATDFDGNYEITAGPNAILTFSYIGYKQKDVKINGRKSLDVTLDADVSALDEVVIIGYGSAKRKDLTGAIASVKGEELDKVKPVTFEGGLAARAAGVQVVQSGGEPGAGFNIRVRGGSSITASNDPLYVIDGFAIQGNSSSTSVGLGNSTTSPLASIDPSTIESIEVLKDASATAIYGSRGANGVVIITTKGGKKGRASLNFETFTGISNIVRPIDLMSGQEFVDFWNDYFPWNGNIAEDDFNTRAFRYDDGTPIDLSDPRVLVTDWQDEISRSALTKSYKVSMSGGGENNTYSGSFSYLNQEGIIKTSAFERYNGNLNINQNISDRLKAGVNLNLGINKNAGIVSAAAENGNGRNGIITSAILFSPVQGINRDGDAEYDENGRIISVRNGDITNPLANLEYNSNNRKAFQSFGSVFVQYRIADGLTFKSSLRGNISATKGTAYFSERIGWGRTANGRAFISNNIGTGLITEQNLNFNKTYGDHNINATAVYEEQQNTFEFNTSGSTGFDLPGVNLDNLSAATEHIPNRSGFSKSTLKSYLARVQYGYKGRYTFNASARYDGSSRFAEGSKYGFFPSAGVAWNVAEENFLKNSNTINTLRFKASYGETGNTNIGSYRSFAQAGVASTILNGNQLITGAAVSQLANPDLTWETTSQFDAGVSLGLFRNRINLDVDYYNKQTKDLLLEVPLPLTSGFEFSFQNLGSLENTGLEISLNTTNITNENFTWTSNFNISFNDNKVLDLGGAEEFFTRAIGDNQIGNDYVIRVGESLGSMFGLQTDGIYNYSDFAAFDGLSDAEAAEKIRADAAEQGIPWYDVVYELKEGTVLSSGQPDATKYRPGMPKFVDQLTVDTDGDGVPDEADGIVNTDDRTIIGNALPKHFGGFTNNFRYKNLDLSIITQWSYGNDIYLKTANKGSAQAIPFLNKIGYVANRWTPETPNTDVPAIWGDGDGGINGVAYSNLIHDGSYFRIGNITLGYELPTDLKSTLGLKSCRIYGAVDNVYVWTNYIGYDPDVSVGNNQLTPGLDADSYPRSRTFRLGLSVGF
ncbi:SusC/RagA family TonB-linked outer membrane protein [Croceivirga sp. JEA036]|uniref:SusC/RagA family TonB-linked outer membrane protein n=1 Tax=Croceivirga sp. JEA036 TaxID=2721162 RepID=UPI00143B50E4|nr:TonB-dependent receptor [Croceivirga sp. JEA036]NJB35215.1 TonB-dependent receptor [Croceivirga sp. JEA036]